MKKFSWFLAAFLLGMLVLHVLREVLPLREPAGVRPLSLERTAPGVSKGHTRIVSLLPSVTEILYALKAEDRIIGVTRFCKFPPQASQKAQVGGYMDTSYEAVYSLNPDLVIVEARDSNQKENLQEMGFDILEADTKSVRGVLDSIRLLGSAVDREEAAAALIQDIEDTIKEIDGRIKSLPRPRVLVIFMRPFGEGRIRDVYISGHNSYFQDLIRMAGGMNAYDGPARITSPIVSAEGILQMNPDIIIEVMTRLDQTHYSVNDVLRDWDSLPGLKARQDKRIYVLTENFMDIPGPRLKQALAALAECIHPEVQWRQP